MSRNGLLEERNTIWKMITQFICWEYCTDYIDRNELLDENLLRRIKPELIYELFEYRRADDKDILLYQLLTTFVMKSNTLLEANCFEEQNVVIEACRDLLKDLCNTSSNLKPMEQHINNLFEDIKIYGSHEEEESIEWKNVFVGSRAILIKEMLKLLPQPYLLKTIQNYKSNCIFEGSKDISVNAAVDLLKTIHVEQKVIEDLKREIMKDDTLLYIMKQNSTNSNDCKASTISAEDSYKTAASDTSSNKCLKSNRKRSERLRHKIQSNNEIQCTKKNSIKRNGDSGLLTSSYFATPQPLPKLNVKKLSSSLNRRITKEMRKPPSPASTISTRSQSGLPRKRLPWATIEEEILVRGVEKYNVGNWKLILSEGGLEKRTVRDLYDKWKNIQKYGHLDDIKSRLREKDKLKLSK